MDRDEGQNTDESPKFTGATANFKIGPCKQTGVINKCQQVMRSARVHKKFKDSTDDPEPERDIWSLPEYNVTVLVTGKPFPGRPELILCWF